MNDTPVTAPGSAQPFKTLDDEAEHDPIGLALAKAAEQFHSYAKDHARKAEATRHKAGFQDDPGIRDSRMEDAAESERKSQVNADMASMMEEALLAHTARIEA